MMSVATMVMVAAFFAIVLFAHGATFVAIGAVAIFFMDTVVIGLFAVLTTVVMMLFISRFNRIMTLFFVSTTVGFMSFFAMMINSMVVLISMPSAMKFSTECTGTKDAQSKGN